MWNKHSIEVVIRTRLSHARTHARTQRIVKRNRSRGGVYYEREILDVFHFVLCCHRYEVLQCRPVEKLIKKRKIADETPLYHVTIEETYDIKCAHIATGHGGRDRMIKETQKKYANISTSSLELFKSLCVECQKKRKRPKTTGVVVRPLISKEYSSREQVDLIDMQSMSRNGFRWIMVYQDRLKNFCVLQKQGAG